MISDTLLVFMWFVLTMLMFLVALGLTKIYQALTYLEKLERGFINDSTDDGK